jgi:hypothetical protein
MAYIHQGKPVDLNLMKANLKHTQYDEEKLLAFLEALRTQAQLMVAPVELEMRVFSDGEEQLYNAEEAKGKVIELVHSWILNQQRLEALELFRQAQGEALRAHIDAGKAVDLELLKMDLKQRPFSQKRFLFLLTGLQQGDSDTHGVATDVIDLVKSQLTLKNICFQFLHFNPQYLHNRDLRSAACRSADASEFVEQVGHLVD